MRPDGPVKDLTDSQKKQASIAGIPADRAGLGAEYPKMIYRPGENHRHKHLDQEIPVGNGQYDPVSERLSPGIPHSTAFVDSHDEELTALEAGWFLSPFPEAQDMQVAKRQIEKAKDDRIAELEAQLAEKRGPGRPPKAPEPELA